MFHRKIALPEHHPQPRSLDHQLAAQAMSASELQHLETHKLQVSMCVSLLRIAILFRQLVENLLVQLRDPMAFNKPTDVVHGSDALSILVSMQTVAPWSTVCAELR